MRETVNTVKIPTKAQLSYKPKNEQESKHLEWLKGLLKEKRRGDWQLVAGMLNISPQSAEKAFYRVYQKNHFESANALEKIINQRKELLQTNSHEKN